MAILTKGTTFADGDQVTSAKLNNLVDAAAFASGAVDDATIQLSTGKIAVKTIQTANIANSAVTSDKIANGSVTTSKLASSVIFVPSGAVMAFAMNSAPTGWLEADGSAVDRTTYADLFSAIGTVYGSGDGSTTFNLPDLRGYFVRGSGTNGDGTASDTFGVKQSDEFKSHTHVVVANAISDSGSGYLAGGNYGSANDGSATSTATGGSETRPKNIAMLYCIKT